MCVQQSFQCVCSVTCIFLKFSRVTPTFDLHELTERDSIEASARGPADRPNNPLSLLLARRRRSELHCDVDGARPTVRQHTSTPKQPAKQPTSKACPGPLQSASHSLALDGGGAGGISQSVDMLRLIPARPADCGRLVWAFGLRSVPLNPRSISLSSFIEPMLLPRLLRVIPSTLSHAPLRRLAEAVRGRDTISEIWSSKKLRAHTPTRADTRVSSACR